MWNWLVQFSSVKVFYSQAGVISKWLARLAGMCLVIGLVVSLILSPPDYQQGESVRIMYLHVPCAILSMGCFLFMGLLAGILLIWKIKLAGILLRSTAFIGACLTAVTLVTGSLWGKPMWGTWWVWDARLTSEFILWMLYLAILAIQSSFRQAEAADKAMAVLALIGLIDLPIIHYSVNWWSTLHQGSSFPLGKKPLIDAAMLWPLGWMFVGLSCFTGWVILQLARGEVLRRSIQASWVLTLL